MDALGFGLVFVGAIAFLLGWVWILFNAFNESVWWGFGVFFFSVIIGPYFAFRFRDDNQRPLFLLVGGIAAMVGGWILWGAGSS